MQHYASLSADTIARWADQFNTMMKSGSLNKVCNTFL
jgi:hypothetical protein